MDITSKILDKIATHFGIESSDLTLDMSVRRDLNAPAIEIADLFPKLEEEFEIEFDADQMDELETIGDIVDYIVDQYEGSKTS